METPAHLQITNLIHRYANAVDEARFDVIADIYRRATIVMAGMELSGTEAAERMRDTVLMYDGLPATHHVMSNTIIDFSADGTTASSSTKFTVFQGPPACDLQVVITGGYLDQFGSEGGEWFFTRREYRTGMLGDLRQHLKSGPGID